MTDVECPHFGRPLEFPGECTLCSGSEAKLKAEQTALGRVFPAKYAGHCHVCRNTIDVGDMIYWVPGDPVVHNECTGGL